MCFNRTFMELKSIKQDFDSLHPVCVLIVPLWNWNERNAFDLSHNDVCFNRTFMELKSLIPFPVLNNCEVLIVFLRFKTLENGEKMKQKCQNKYPQMQF